MMINMMTMILAIADYLIVLNKIDDNLYNFIDDFYDEAELINEAKCYLLNNSTLEDLSLSKGVAVVSKHFNGYDISYNGLNIYLEVEDNIVTDYTIK